MNRPLYVIHWRRLSEPSVYLNCRGLSERDVVRRLVGAVANSGPVIIDRVERQAA